MKTKIYIFFIFFFSFLGLKAQDNFTPKEREILSSRGEIIIGFAKQGDIRVLTRMMSIDNVTADSIFAYCNKEQFLGFKKLGFNYRVLPSPGEVNPPVMAESVNDFLISNWDVYPTYQQYDSMMHYYANTYPQLCEYVEIGTLTSGRKIMALKISDSVNIQEKEPRFLYTSTMHGDEVTGYVLMLRLIDYLLTNYGTNSKVTELINNIEIWINPLANPDGTYKGGNTNIGAAIRGNNNSIDINRNFPDPAVGQHPDGKAWQQETLKFMNIADSLQFTMSANFHGGAEVLNYPWDTWSKLTADNNWWQYVCMKYADTVHTSALPVTDYLKDFTTGVTNGYAWYTITGGRQDFMNYFHRCREVTIELSSNKMPVASTLPNYWNYNYKSLLNYMQACLYGLHGTITDSVTGLPLKAKVFIDSWDKDSSHVYSSLLGDYHRMLYQGVYNVTYSADGYMPKTIAVTIANDSTVVKDVQLVKNGTGFDKKIEIENIKLFPNPASNQLNIINLGNIKIFKIEVFTSEGRLLMEEINNINTLDVSGLLSGFYILKFDFDNGISGFKTFVKE